jgi:hypothetical protein
MPKTLIVLAAAAGIGLAAFAASPGGGKMAGDLGHSLAAGVILGSAVWPYGVSPIQPELQAKLLLDSPGCDGDDQCGMYGLASATFVNGGDNGTAD